MYASPIVSIGGQRNPTLPDTGHRAGEATGPWSVSVGILPVSIGFPFGVSVFVPPNIPLPAKIVTQVLEPIDIVGEFGQEPDILEVDAHVRSVMQQALDKLARERRLPLIG